MLGLFLADWSAQVLHCGCHCLQVSMSALAAGWNALVLDLRERDLLSNRELASLSFEQLQLTHSQKQHLRDLPHVGDLGLTSVLPARCACLAAQVGIGGVVETATGCLFP